jgi:hypothetical protein
MKPYLVLKTYEPTVWRSWRIGTELTAYTKSQGLVPHFDPQHPAQDWVPWVDPQLHAEVRIWTVKNPAGAGWHQDGDTTPGSDMKCAIVLWADSDPTEFSYEGKIWQPKPYEIVIFKNLTCSHRRPPHLKADSERWVFRQRVKVPNWKELP